MEISKIELFCEPPTQGRTDEWVSQSVSQINLLL